MRGDQEQQIEDTLLAMEGMLKPRLREAWQRWGKDFAWYEVNEFCGIEEVDAKNLAFSFQKAATYARVWCEAGDRAKYKASLQEGAARLKKWKRALIYPDGRIAPLLEQQKGRPFIQPHVIRLAEVLYVHLGYFLRQGRNHQLQYLWDVIFPEKRGIGELRKTLRDSEFSRSIFTYAEELLKFFAERGMSLSEVKDDVEIIFETAGYWFEELIEEERLKASRRSH